jgi:hypothetical protein
MEETGMSGIINRTKDPNKIPYPGSSALSVPLPNEIPPPPDLDTLPYSVLHAGAVETLITLNEDLMARLKINIRRNSLLEQQILDKEKYEAEMADENRALLGQIELNKEKEQINREKAAETQMWRQSIEKSAHEIARLRAYRRRIIRWIQPALAKAKQQQEQLAKVININAIRDTQVAELRRHMTEVTATMQNQEKIHQRDQTTLVETFESQLKNLECELEKARPKAARFEDITAKSADMQNRVVFLERRNEELEIRSRDEITTLQEQLVKYRSEAKILAYETIELTKDINSKNASIEELKKSLAQLQDQFESMQAVWAESQRRLESSKSQHETLNRLNQELSQQIKLLKSNDGAALHMHSLEIIEPEQGL